MNTDPICNLEKKIVQKRRREVKRVPENIRQSQCFEHYKNLKEHFHGQPKTKMKKARQLFWKLQNNNVVLLHIKTLL